MVLIAKHLEQPLVSPRSAAIIRRAGSLPRDQARELRATFDGLTGPTLLITLRALATRPAIKRRVDLMVADHSIEFFADAAAFREWLEHRHDSTPEGIWVKFAKKGTGIASLDFAGALDEALCFGWIDGQSKRVDEIYYLQGFTPRRARSSWSKRNRAKVEALIAEGRMTPAGQAEIDRAKADGRWDRAYDSAKHAEVPQDFLDELAKDRAAKAFFATLNSQNRFAVYHRLQAARRPETRARRIAKIVAQFADGEKLV
jgi:uncharacterized protein YdeI (YjbR/CyaY-like superfamily)